MAGNQAGKQLFPQKTRLGNPKTKVWKPEIRLWSLAKSLASEPYIGDTFSLYLVRLKCELTVLLLLLSFVK